MKCASTLLAPTQGFTSVNNIFFGTWAPAGVKNMTNILQCMAWPDYWVTRRHARTRGSFLAKQKPATCRAKRPKRRYKPFLKPYGAKIHREPHGVKKHTVWWKRFDKRKWLKRFDHKLFDKQNEITRCGKRTLFERFGKRWWIKLFGKRWRIK